MARFFRNKKPRANLSMLPIALSDMLSEVLSGLGGVADRLSKVKFVAPEPVSDETIELAAQFCGLMERYINRPVEDGLANGIVFTDLSSDEVTAVNDWLDSKTKFWKALEEGWVTMRMTPGSAIWIDTGAPDLSKPMRPQEMKNLRDLVVLDHFSISAKMRNKHTKPVIWETGEMDIPGKAIHASRLLLFPGKFISKNHRYKNRGWGARETDRIWEAWIHFKTAFLTPANIALTYEESAVSWEGLNNQLTTEEGKRRVRERVFDLEAVKSFFRVRLLDAKDKFERHGAPVSGLDKILEKAERYFIASTGWPHTVIMGESPGASLDGGGNGKSQKEDWQRIIKADQERVLRGPITQFLEASKEELKRLYSLPFESLAFDFAPILQESAKDKSDREKTDSETAKNYYGMGAMNSEEVRDQAVKKDVYALDTFKMPKADRLVEEE